MKNKFKKIMSIVGSTFMVGATVGMAMAAGGAFPSPFVQDGNEEYAIVYGSGSAASDAVGANSINTYLNTFYTSKRTETVTTTSTTPVDSTSTTSSDFSSSVSLSDEVELGLNNIVDGTKLRVKIEDNKLSTLLDSKVYWDNGDGEERYDIHEEILLTNDAGESTLELVTNLYHQDGEDFDSDKLVVLQNDKSLRYRLVFDDELLLPENDADELEVTILGKEYVITDFDTDFDEITISLSEERVVKKGTTLSINGITLTIGEIFDHAVEVNGVLVKDGNSIKRIDGLEVQVDSTAVHSDSVLSKAVIKVGEDIKRVVSNGDEYVKDDETWEWDLGLNNEGKQYIGVKYALKNVAYDEDEPEENPIFEGQSYIFPENYAALSFDGLTNVAYKDFELSFDDKDLYDIGNKVGNDINVAILEGEEDDSITLFYKDNEIETNSIYFQYNSNNVSLYFNDVDGDVDDKGSIQLNGSYEFSLGEVITNKPVTDVEGILTAEVESTVTYNEISRQYEYEVTILKVVPLGGEIQWDDKFLYFDGETFYWVTPTGIPGQYGYDVTTNKPVTDVEGILTAEVGSTVTYNKISEQYEYEVTTPGIEGDISYKNIAKLIVKDTEIEVGLDLNADKTVYLTLTNEDKVTRMLLNTTNDDFRFLGLEKEDSDSKDIVVNGKSIGTKDYDVMDNYGTIIRDPENYADDDRVVFSVPDEQILATISINGQGEVITTTASSNNAEVNGTNVTTYTTTTEVPTIGGIVLKDTEIAGVKDKNLIIVGGSCINAEAARLLGGKTCGSEFTLKTGVTAGKALIQTFVSPHDASKIAVVIAGYNAEDTTRAVSTVISDATLDLKVNQQKVI